MASVAVHSAIAAFLLTSIYIQVVVAQSPTPSCISNLVPCEDYLNSTHPPVSCCNPLREAVTHQLDCLCNLYDNKELMKSFHINVTQALALPGYCGIPGNTSSCNASAPSSSSASNPPPAAPATQNVKKSNGVRSIACIGLSMPLVLVASWILW